VCFIRFSGSERDALVNENKQLEKYKPAKKTTPEWCQEQVKEIASAVYLIEAKANLLMDDERLREDMPLQAEIDKELRQIQGTFNVLLRSWYDYSDIDE